MKWGIHRKLGTMLTACRTYCWYSVYVAQVAIQTYLQAGVVHRSVVRSLYAGHVVSDDHLLRCAPLAHLLNQHVTELFVEENVYDEVSSRVKNDERIGYGVQIEPEVTTYVHGMRRQSPHHSVGELRQLTDDCDDDDDDENERHRVIILTTLILHLHSTMSLQRFYQENVQQCEDVYGQNE